MHNTNLDILISLKILRNDTFYVNQRIVFLEKQRKTLNKQIFAFIAISHPLYIPQLLQLVKKVSGIIRQIVHGVGYEECK